MAFLFFLIFHLACSQRAKNDVSADSEAEDSIRSESFLPDSGPVNGREIELTSIYLPVKGRGTLLLELNYLELTVKVFHESDIMNALQTLGPVQSDIDFRTNLYLNDPIRIFNPEDLNFDGYKDIKIPITTGSGGIWYVVFLYDSKTNLFVENNALSQMTSIVADSISKKLHSHDVGAMGGAFYNYTTYSWKGDNLFIERREIQEGLNESTPEILIRTVLEVNSEEGLDTAAVVKIWMEKDKEHWCLMKGKWEALLSSPHPGDGVIRTMQCK
jgi:hypothetical protein